METVGKLFREAGVTRYSWLNLRNAYRQNELSEALEAMEAKYHGRDETAFFAPLVNTSKSKHQPYHRWIRYREGYAGELVKEILRRFPIASDEAVLDPMCGSGSTMVACNELGVTSLGLDVNPYAILATRVKGFALDSEQIKKADQLCSDILSMSRTIGYNSNEFDIDISKYFSVENFRQVLSIKNSIKNLCSGLWYDLFNFALLGVIEECSNRMKDGNGLATRESKVTDCYEVFHLQVQKILEDFLKHPFSSGNLSSALLISAKDLDDQIVINELKGKSLGSIIFSPPYANSFDYFESYKMEFVFGEWSRADQIHDKRQALIRSFRLGYGKELKSDIPIVELLCKELWIKIPEKELKTGKRDGRTRLVPNMIRAYFEDMKDVIKKGMELLKAGGYMHIVVDQSSYVGVAIPTDTIFAHIADSLGHEVVQIIKCRKANTSGQQLKEFPYLKELLRESIVTIRKINA